MTTTTTSAAVSDALALGFIDSPLISAPIATARHVRRRAVRPRLTFDRAGKQYSEPRANPFADKPFPEIGPTHADL
jgi:hypothetical protein